MNFRQAIIAKTGNTLLGPGQFALLNAKEAVLQITKGEVDVYAVKNSGDWQQKKIFLFEIKQGGALFSLPTEEAGALEFIITAPKGATVRAMTRSGMLATVAASGEHILEAIWFMLESWLEALLSATVVTAPPRSFLPVDSGQTVELKLNQVVRPYKYLTWTHINRGSFRYGALLEYEAVANTMLPLISRGWLTAAEDGEITGMSTEQVFPVSLCENPDIFWQPLKDCHKLAVRLIEQYFSTVVSRDSEQIKTRRAQQDKLLRGAAINLLKNNMPDLPPVTGAISGMPMVDAVKMIAGFLGIAEDEVRLPAGMNPQRQDALMLKSVAKIAGLQVRRVKLEEGWHRLDVGALLVSFGPEEAPTVLLPTSPGKYRMYVTDGTYREVTDETARQISEDAYVFYTSLSEKKATLVGWFKFMLGKCWRIDFYTLIFTSIVAGLIAIITPLVTQTIFDDIIPVYDRQGHLMVVQVMIVSSFATAGVGFARNVAILRLRSRSLLTAEASLWLRLLSLPTTFFRRYETGDLVQRMNGVTQFASLLSTSAISTIFNAAFSFWSLLVMLYYSWKLALAAMFVWIIYLGICAILAWRLVNANRRMTEASGETAGQVLQILNGLSKFRLKNAEVHAFHLWSRKFGEQWRWNYSSLWRGNWLGLFTSIQPVLMSMLIFWLTMHFLQETGVNTSNVFITHPDFMGFNSALGGLNAALVGMIPVFVGILQTIPLIERIKPILEAEPEETDEKAEAGDLTGRIEVNNVSFRYAPERPLVLRNISITVPPGQFAAVVGASGSGKSTLLRLLLGFERPENGSVCYDGQDISELNLTSVRSQMGVVLQNGQIMSGDIFSNIVGSLPLTQSDAWEAAEMVGLAEDIRQMPMGLNTVISEGASNISGGQRQRILIARAIVHRPRIIFFDEATSALDNRTQAIVTESIARLKATRIIVAHRLSTIINADIIYVMDKGSVVESGTYNELMQGGGLFATLAKRQML